MEANEPENRRTVPVLCHILKLMPDEPVSVYDGRTVGRPPRSMHDERDEADFLRSAAETRGVRIIHDWSGGQSIVSTIVTAISDLTGESTIEPVHDRVDPDALEALFRPISADRRRDRGQVTFPLAGYDVTVDANGLILIEEH